MGDGMMADNDFKAYSLKLTTVDEWVPSYPLRMEVPECGNFEFRSEKGETLTAWKEIETLETSIWWIKLPEHEITEISVFKTGKLNSVMFQDVIPILEDFGPEKMRNITNEKWCKK